MKLSSSFPGTSGEQQLRPEGLNGAPMHQVKLLRITSLSIPGKVQSKNTQMLPFTMPKLHLNPKILSDRKRE